MGIPSQFRLSRAYAGLLKCIFYLCASDHEPLECIGDDNLASGLLLTPGVEIFNCIYPFCLKSGHMRLNLKIDQLLTISYTSDYYYVFKIASLFFMQ